MYYYLFQEANNVSEVALISIVQYEPQQEKTVHAKCLQRNHIIDSFRIFAPV